MIQCAGRGGLRRGGLAAPFACPRCQTAEDFARKGKRTRERKLHTAAGPVELVLWNVGCRECGRVFAPLLIMLGLSGKRRTDRLTVNLAELGTQVSFARAAELSRQLAGTTATAGQAHNALADTAALLTGTDGTLGPGHPSPDVVMLEGTGARAGTNKKRSGCSLGAGVDRPVRAAWAAPGAHPPARAHRRRGLARDGRAAGRVACPGAGRARRRDRAHQPDPAAVARHPDRALLVAPAPRVAQGLYADDDANRHVNPHWARYMSDHLAQLLRDTIRHEQTTEEALAAWDAFTQATPNKLTSAQGYLASARSHAFTCIDPDLRSRLARLGGPELGTGVVERVMREVNARTDIGARPRERSRPTRSAHRAHRTTAAPPGLEGDQTGHPPAQHHPLPPAKIQRLTTLPKHPKDLIHRS